MGRFLIFKAVILLTNLSFANQQEARNDFAWADIGDTIIDVREEEKVQRDYKSIQKDEGLLSIGSFITLSRDINLRAKVGGQKIKPVYKGAVYQILGIKTQGAKRFYKIKDGLDVGYIYAGTKASYAGWAKQTWSEESKVIPQIGDYVKIKRKRGLRISKKPSEESFSYIPRGVQVQVESIVESEGDLFYKMKYKSKEGFARIGSASQVSKSKNWKFVR